MDCGDTKMLDTIIGGLLAMAGGVLAQVLTARMVRKTRMDELIAERKVEANAEAYARAKQIQAMWIQASQEDTNAAMLGFEEWFFKTRLFLPGKFPDLWMAVRNDIAQFGFKMRQQKVPESELAAVSRRIRENLNAAILEVYKDMKVPPMDLSTVSGVAGGGGGHTA